MTRAFSIFVGVCVIVSVWTWMIASIDTTRVGWWAIYLVACKLAMACFATGPVYREYLR